MASNELSLNLLPHTELFRVLHNHLGRAAVYFVEPGNTYTQTVNWFGAYASKNGLRMRSKKLLVLEDETTLPRVAVRVWFYMGDE